MAAAVAPVAVALPKGMRQFALGAWTATVLAYVTHFVVVASGSARLIMADQAEQWTRQELAPLRRDGWRVAHRVMFRGDEDIDSVLIGPAGAIVVETKWGSEDWSSRGQQKWVAMAADQVRNNTRLVERQLRQATGPVPVHSVVALWPSDENLGSRALEGVTVLPGKFLREWIEALPRPPLDRKQVDAAWTFLDAHIARRDESDLRRHGAMPRSPGEYALDLLQVPAGILVGLSAFAYALRWFGWPLALAPGALGAGLCVYGLRLRRIHRFAAGASVGLSCVVVGFTLLWLRDVLL